MNRIIVSLLAVSLAMASVGLNHVAAAPVTKPIVKIVDITVNSIEATEEGLLANATVVLDIVGRLVTKEVEIPIILGGSEGAECAILHLALGPIDLDLLGLVVELDDCAGGPVVVDITAIEGGGLLGDLLCSIAGGLAGGGLLEDVLASLTDEELALVLSGLTDVLNELLDELLENGTTEAAFTASQHNNRCDILILSIPEGIFLELLGLQIETSPICLDVYAVRGRGNLLGNLLCNLTGLLDRPANQKAIEKIVKNILKRLDKLGL